MYRNKLTKSRIYWYRDGIKPSEKNWTKCGVKNIGGKNFPKFTYQYNPDSCNIYVLFIKFNHLVDSTYIILFRQLF